MNESLVTTLHEKYPLMFDRKIWCECGDGWYDLIYTLCGSIQQYISQSESHRKWAILHNQKIESKSSIQTVPNVVPDVVEQVKILQIKEKFGSLRFYVRNGDKHIHGMISFAEKYSTKICEECGQPGKIRDGKWIRTLCDQHHIKSGLGAENLDL